MPKAQSKTEKVAVTAWWLTDGAEDCVHCDQPYHYEMEFRCPDCDGPTCPHCKHERAGGDHVCPECAPKVKTRPKEKRRG